MYFPSMKLIAQEHTVSEFKVYIVGPIAWTHTCAVTTDSTQNLPFIPSHEGLKQSTK